MSIELMSRVWRMAELSSTDKMVLLALADAANDDGVTWLSVAGKRGSKNPLTLKCSLSERAVQMAIGRLVDNGHLSRRERPGRGVIYTVHPRTTCTPAADAPPHDVRKTPAPRAPNTSVNHHTPLKGGAPERVEAEKRDKRGTRIPLEWEPPPVGELPPSIRAVVSGWPDGAYAFAADGFRSHWAAESGRSATKLDWRAAWCKWLTGEADKVARMARQGVSFGSPTPAGAAKGTIVAEDGCAEAAAVKKQLRRRLGAATWASWIAPCRFELEGRMLVIRPDSAFATDWIKNNLAPKIATYVGDRTLHFVTPKKGIKHGASSQA